MVKREDVEAILRDVLESAERSEVQPCDMTFRVEGDYLAALCRAWLALDGAPVRMVGDGISYGVSVAGTGIANGTRVRIVPEAGQEVGK